MDTGEGLIHRDILIALWEVTKRKEGAKVFLKPTPCPNTQRVTSRVLGGKGHMLREVNVIFVQSDFRTRKILEDIEGLKDVDTRL